MGGVEAVDGRPVKDSGEVLRRGAESIIAGEGGKKEGKGRRHGKGPSE